MSEKYHATHKEPDWCEPGSPPLQIFATIAADTKCCVADSVQHMNLQFGSRAAGEAEVDARGILVAGHVDAEAEIEVRQGLAYRVFYNEDNIILLTTFKICWWTCGGYPSKHVEIEVYEEDNEKPKLVLENCCLPPSVEDCDCCFTHVVSECVRCSDFPQRRRKKILFQVQVVDGCGNRKTCQLEGLAP